MNETVYTIICNVWITRRKRYYLVMGPNNKHLFKSMYLSQVLEWLQAEGAVNIHFQTDELSWLCTVTDRDYLME